MARVERLGGVELWLGDAVEVMAALPPGFDALVTDPPYSSGGLLRGDRCLRSTKDKYVQGGSAQLAVHNVEFTGDQRDQRSWAFWVSCWMMVARRVLRPGAYALCFSDWRQLPALTDAMQAAGLVWRGVVAWDKTNSSRAPHKGYFRHQCEFVCWGSNGGLPVATHAGPFPGLVTERVDPRHKHHMTGKPVRLMEALLDVVPAGGLVLDPFMGSGSTLVAAVRKGQRAVGVELDPRHFDTACRRVEAEVKAVEAAVKAA